MTKPLPITHEGGPHDAVESSNRRGRRRLATALGGLVAIATVAGAASGIFGHRGGDEEVRQEPIERTATTAVKHPELEPVREDAQETIENLAERIMTHEAIPDDNQHIYSVSIPAEGGWYGMHVDLGDSTIEKDNPQDARGVVVFMNRYVDGNPNQTEQVFRMSLGKAVNADEYLMDLAITGNRGGQGRALYSTGNPEDWDANELLSQDILDAITAQADVVLGMAEHAEPVPSRN